MHVFQTFLNKRLEFGRGHKIKQLSRASPDLYTPVAEGDLQKIHAFLHSIWLHQTRKVL